MATTLHQLTNGIHFLMKWLGIFVGIFLILAILVRLTINVKEYFFPTPPPPATVLFGKLPQIVFPQGMKLSNVKYTHDTISGLLPTFPGKLSVYPIQKHMPNLTDFTDAERAVNTTEFASNPNGLSETLYEWFSQKPQVKALTLDIVSKNFTITSHFLTDGTIPIEKQAPSKDTALATIQNFLQTLRATPSDTDDSKTKITFFDISKGTLIPVSTGNAGQVTHVEFFQKDIENLPIAYQNPNESSLAFSVAATKTSQSIVTANFIHHTISAENSTYPIKTAQEAFTDLQKGKAYIASFTGTSQTIIVRDLTLAYFASEDNQQYLMPIIIIKGDDNFIAYVSAVKDEWIQK